MLTFKGKELIQKKDITDKDGDCYRYWKI